MGAQILESEHDEKDRHRAPVGDVIGAAHPGLRREFVTLSEFAFDLHDDQITFTRARGKLSTVQT